MAKNPFWHLSVPFVCGRVNFILRLLAGIGKAVRRNMGLKQGQMLAPALAQTKNGLRPNQHKPSFV